MTMLIWIAGLIPIIAILGFLNKSIFTAPLIIPGASWQEILLPYLMTHKIMLLSMLLLIFFFTAWMGLGIIRLSLKIYNGGKWDIQVLFPSPLLIIKAFIAMICFLFIAMLGLLLFVIPGIYWIVRAHFFLFALVEGEGIFESFATSLRITQHRSWCILGQLLVNSVLVRVCAFFSFTSILSSVYVYHYLKENRGGCP